MEVDFGSRVDQRQHIDVALSSLMVSMETVLLMSKTKKYWIEKSELILVKQ